MNQKKEAAIVGVYEYPLRKVGAKLSPLQIKAACAVEALKDAGLDWSDVDGIYDAGESGPMSGLTISEYFSVNIIIASAKSPTYNKSLLGLPVPQSINEFCLFFFALYIFLINAGTTWLL